MTTTPDTTPEYKEPSSVDIAEPGLAMDRVLKRLSNLESQRILKQMTNIYCDDDGQLELTTESATVICGMLETSIALIDWLTDNIYSYENQTFDENTTLALTCARRARGYVGDLAVASESVQLELRRLIVNNRCRRQDVEWLNHLAVVAQLAKEYEEEEAQQQEAEEE